MSLGKISGDPVFVNHSLHFGCALQRLYFVGEVDGNAVGAGVLHVPSSLLHTPLVQSRGPSAHCLPAPQRGQSLLPPQSTSASSLSLAPLPQPALLGKR